MQIQWYPGHMTKARRMMEENIRLIDLVIEIIDARAALSTRNPDIDVLAKNKFRLVILNKADLADPNDNQKWINYFKDRNIYCIEADSRNKKSLKNLDKIIKEVCKEKIERDRKRGILQRSIKCMVVGIPNVGKSTFINSLAGKSCTKTGNKPGVTKGKQWITISKDLELLDTPGILWPKFEDESIGIKLAIIGSVNEDILDIVELAVNYIGIVKDKYPGKLTDKYNVDEKLENLSVLEAITVNRNLIKTGGEADILRGANLVLDDFRASRIGRLSLDLFPSED